MVGNIYFVDCLCLQSRTSFVSVVFTFNPSPNDFAPSTPMLHPIVMYKQYTMKVFMCTSFLYISVLHVTISSVSDVFVFNASPNDLQPISPILFPVFNVLCE